MVDLLADIHPNTTGNILEFQRSGGGEGGGVLDWNSKGEREGGGCWTGILKAEHEMFMHSW